MKRVVLVVLAAGLALAGCGADGTAQPGPGAPDRVAVTVLAAASLTDVFTTLEQQFEAANPTADVRFSFGGSSDLATQIVNGAPADVFASANEKQMKVVAEAGKVAGVPKPFTTNVLTIVVPLGNPKGIRTFADLAKPDVTELVCAPQVPCGAATKEIEKATNITLSPASEEPDVRSVLAKVQAGEADAGLVYLTDARSAAGKVKQINFPEAKDAVNVYPIAAINGAPQPRLAAAFVAFILSPAGQRELTAAGFSPSS
ncbi:MAG TPA: molybdate ABC transporter substrate-binding protein [Pseudonocardiaceae bacterium]|nr:molybdate ABC transporter substrate-binding protein [Pseudonocardiaceae bacterium]